MNDYSEALIDKIRPHIEPYIITFTQEQAGFETKVIENVLTVKMKERTYQMCDRLKKDLVIEGKEEVILADTGVKLMTKLHQMYSGTIKFESGNRMVLDDSKAQYILNRFGSDKIAIFYKFSAELDMLKDVIGDRLTQDISEFDSDPNKWIALQIISGREGTNLSSADFLLYLNIDFSAVSYWQSRDRLTTMDRKENDVFWIFSKGGIESKIYKTVKNKKDFTLSVFKKEMK